MGLTAKGLFLTLGIANLLAAAYIIRLLPHEFWPRAAGFLFRLFYRVEVKGLEHLDAAGRKALIVANHTSLLDGPLLSAFLPEKASFAINTQMAKALVGEACLRAVRTLPHGPRQPDVVAHPGGCFEARQARGDFP